jgi:hypothetical protein
VHDTCGLMGGGEDWTSAVSGLVWWNNTILRPNTSHAHSPTHDHHMHASVPTLTLLNTHTTLMYTNEPPHSPDNIEGGHGHRTGLYI